MKSRIWIVFLVWASGIFGTIGYMYANAENIVGKQVLGICMLACLLVGLSLIGKEDN
jgi:hypothetical protein